MPGSNSRCPVSPHPPPGPASNTANKVQATIVGGPNTVEKRSNQTVADERHLQRYLAANCFGDTVGRRGLDTPVGHLCDARRARRCDAQFAGHVGANLAVGNTGATLLAVLTVLVPFTGYSRSLTALAAIDNITQP